MIDHRLRTVTGFALFSSFALGGLTPLPLLAQDAAAPDGEAAAPLEIQDPFLLQEPETPEEFLRAAVQAQELARPELARLYLERFWAEKPSDDELLQIREKLGPVAFQRLANQPELQPLSVEIAEHVTRLFRERGATPAHLNNLMDNLSGTSDESFAARQALVNTGPQAVPAILNRLRTATDDSVRRQMTDILIGMGPEVLPAMHAALDSPDNAVRVPALAVIGRIGSRDSISRLYYLAYGPNQPPRLQQIARATLAQIAESSRTAAEIAEPADVAQQLREAALTEIDPARTDATDEIAGPVTLWTWDAAQDTLRRAPIPAEQARLYQATLYARDAFRIAPQRTEAQALYLALRLELEAAQAGTFEPPVGPNTTANVLLTSGPALAQATLNEAVSADLPRATVGALGVLAQVGSPNLLFGGETGLREALNATHPRVQLAAAVAVLRLNPDRSFSDSERVVEILTRALADTGNGTAVIIDPDYQRGATLASYAGEVGYESVVAATGQQGFRLATERVTPDFVLVNLNVDHWGLSQTLANFRADTRTHSVPIIVVGPAEGSWDAKAWEGAAGYVYQRGRDDHDPRGAVEETLTGVSKTDYIVETATSAVFHAQIAPILAARIPTPLTNADRQQAREIAAYWLAQIADRGLTHRYPLAEAESALAHAVADPALANNALIALAAIPTRTAQQTIAMSLLTGGIDEAQRVLAAEMLADHIRRYGILLDADTARSIAQQPAQAQSPQLRAALTALHGLLHSRPVDAPARISQLPPVAPPIAPAAAP